MAGDTNGAKAAFHDFLSKIPVPAGNASHKYQGAELFFEMYRYLTGQGIWNGHVGYSDYLSTDTKNLDDVTDEAHDLMWGYGDRVRHELPHAN